MYTLSIYSECRRFKIELDTSITAILEAVGCDFDPDG